MLIILIFFYICDKFEYICPVSSETAQHQRQSSRVSDKGQDDLQGVPRQSSQEMSQGC